MPWLIQPQEDSSPATFHLKLYVLSFLWKSYIFPYLLKHSKIWPATDPVWMSEWGWSLGKADTVGGEVKKEELCLDLRQAKVSVSRRVKKTVVRRERRGLRAQDQGGDLLWRIWLPSWNRSIPFWTPWERRDSRKHTRLHPKSAGERFQNLHSSSTCWLPFALIWFSPFSFHVVSCRGSVQYLLCNIY